MTNFSAVGVQILYEDTETFNRISGQYNEITEQGFLDQLKLIQSELAELEEGLNNSDPIEQLDGCLDVLVTTFGYLQRMESRYGINISGASSLVGENNLSKFHTTEEEALKTVAFYTSKNVQTYHSYNAEYDLWVVS